VKLCPIPVCLLGLLLLAGSGNTVAQELSIPMTTAIAYRQKVGGPRRAPSRAISSLDQIRAPAVISK